jgi:hypothetical protein
LASGESVVSIQLPSKGAGAQPALLRDANALKSVEVFLAKFGVPNCEHSSFYALHICRRFAGILVDRDAARASSTSRSGSNRLE